MSLKDYIYEKPVIRTDRLTIREMCADDVPALREWTADKDIYSYWGKSPGKTDKNPELQRLWTDVDVNNTASCRVLEKCGFTREGTVRQGKMVSVWCDYHLYGILKSDLEEYRTAETR